MPDPIVTPPVVPPVVPPVTPPVTPPVVPPVETPVVPPVTPPAAIVYDLKLAEKSALLPADVEEIVALAKEKNLTNEQAGMLLSQRETAAAAVTSRAEVQLAANVAGWQAEVKADKDFGGTKYDGTLLSVKLATDKFAGAYPAHAAKLQAGLEQSGLGNYPPFVAMIAYFGKLMGEDKGLGGAAGAGGSAGERLSDKEVFYPNP